MLSRRTCVNAVIALAVATMVLFFVANTFFISLNTALNCQGITVRNPLREYGCATGWSAPAPSILGCSCLTRYIDQPALFANINYDMPNITGRAVYDGLVAFYNRSCLHNRTLSEKAELGAMAAAAVFLSPTLLHVKYYCGHDEAYMEDVASDNVWWCVDELFTNELRARSYTGRPPVTISYTTQPEQSEAWS